MWLEASDQGRDQCEETREVGRALVSTSVGLW